MVTQSILELLLLLLFIINFTDEQIFFLCLERDIQIPFQGYNIVLLN